MKIFKIAQMEYGPNEEYMEYGHLDDNSSKDAYDKSLWMIEGKSISVKTIAEVNIESGVDENYFEEMYHGNVFDTLDNSSFFGRFDKKKNICTFSINDGHSLARTWKFSGIPSWVEKLLRSTFGESIRIIHYG